MNFLSKPLGRNRRNKKGSPSANDDLFRKFVEQSSEGFAIADEQGIIIQWNRALETLSGISRAEAIGKTFWDIQFATTVPELRTPEHRDHLRDSIRAFLKNGTADYMGRLVEGEILRPDGQRRAVVQTVYPITTGRGYRLASILHDVTGQRQMEQALKSSEERFRKFFDLSLIGSAIIAPDGTWLAVNDKFCSIVGYTRQKLQTLTWMDLTPPEDLREEWPLYEKALQTGIVTRQLQEKRYRHRDGRAITVELSTSPVQNPDGSVDYFIALVQDITERKKAQQELQASERLLHDVIEFLPDATFVIDREKKVIVWNRALEDMTGVRAEEMLGKGDCEYAIPFYGERRPILIDFAAEFQEGIERKYTGVVRRGDTLIGEAFIPTLGPGGTYLWGIAKPLYDAAGAVTGFIESIRDITERKKAEQALLLSEERYRSVVDSATDAIITVNGHGAVVFWNAGAERIYGYTKDEIAGAMVGNIAPERYRSAHMDWLRKIISQNGRGPGAQKAIEGTGLRKNGEEFALESSGSVWAAGGEYFYTFIVRDITERKQSEAALRESEERFRKMAEQIHDGLTIVEDDRVIYVNERQCEITGYSREELLFLKNSDIALPEDREKIAATYREFLRTGEQPPDTEYRIRRRDGSVRFLSNRYSVNRQGPGIYGLYIVTTDITDRRKTEEALRLTQYAIDHSVEAAYWIRPDGTFFYVNEAACRSLGYSSDELLGMAVDAVAPEWPAAEWHARYEYLKHSGGVTFESEHRRKDGTTFPVQVTANYSAFEGQEFILAFVVDITRQKMMQQEALRSAHFASIGELAAGVAHEINNPITGIINYAGLICEGIESRDESVDIARRIMKEGERIGSIVSNLLSFARDEGGEPEPSSVEEIFSDAQALFHKKLSQNNIIVEKNFAPELPRIIVNPQKIEQVFVNCLSNAVDALNAKYPGVHQDKRLEVQAAVLALDTKPYVRVILHDHGIGIPDTLIDKICNPFFSTKATGKGTGLGLSISYNIIRDYNGRLLFESREGAYTRVIIDLPALA